MAIFSATSLALFMAVGVTSGTASTSEVDSQQMFLSQEIGEQNDQDAIEMLVSAVEVALGLEHRKFLQSRLPNLESHIVKLLPAVPKNEYGRVGPTGTRYLMHRFFVQGHGWYVKGIDPAGGAWNASSPIKALGDLVPAHVQALFEELLIARGFGLPELAVLAGTIEAAVRHEARELLRLAYDALLVPRNPGSWVTVEQADEIIDVHMSSFILGESLVASGKKKVTPRTVRRRLRKITSIYPGWPATQGWLRGVRKTAISESHHKLQFEDVAAVIDEVGDQYGAWQDRECFSLKKDMVKLEDGHARGCVRLSDFLNSGHWQFAESPEYLRSLGSFEESNPREPHVLVANYIMSTSNCVANSNFYRVCCRDMCGELHDSIATAVGAHVATPAQIAAAMDQPPSDILLQRLRDVASRSGGRVPLHGRLFAQWLHQLRPRSCPFPHLAGATKPQWIEAYEQASGHASTVEKDDIQTVLKRFYPNGIAPKANATGSANSLSCVPWRPQEELLMVEIPLEANSSAKCTGLVLVVAVISLLFGLIKTVRRVQFEASGAGKRAEGCESRVV